MKSLFLVLALAVALATAIPAGAQTATYYTSTSAAVTQAALTITVVSTTNLVATTQQQVEYGVLSDAYGAAELVQINTVNTSTKQVGVTRGLGGIQTAHVSGAVLYFGPGGGASVGLGSPFTNTSPQIGAACTSTQYPYLPIVNYATGSVFNCSGSRWVSGAYGVSPQTAAYTATLGDYLIEYTSILGGAKTITLPTPVAGMRGKVYIIKNSSAMATNTIWLTGTVDGSTLTAVLGAYAGTRIFTDGSGWFTW